MIFHGFGAMLVGAKGHDDGQKSGRVTASSLEYYQAAHGPFCLSDVPSGGRRLEQQVAGVGTRRFDHKTRRATGRSQSAMRQGSPRATVDPTGPLAGGPEGAEYAPFVPYFLCGVVNFSKNQRGPKGGA